MKYGMGVFVAVLMMVCCAAACAADAVAGAPVAGCDWAKIGWGALGGFIASLMGWAKNRDAQTDAQEPFGGKYLVSTMAVGVLIGAIGAWAGKGSFIDSLNWAQSSAFWAAATMAAEVGLKVIFRQSAPRIMDIINTLKGAGSGAADPSTTQKP
jgi:hypothetical protein